MVSMSTRDVRVGSKLPVHEGGQLCPELGLKRTLSGEKRTSLRKCRVDTTL